MTGEIDSKDIKRLRDFKKYIEKTKDPRVLRLKVVFLEVCVQTILDKCTGDIQSTANITMQKIQEFKLNDVTRFELCRWIQTLICVMSQN